MQSLDVFTIKELGQRSDELLHAAEQGRLSLITTDGRPAILAIPFNERLLDLGIHRAMAVHLFESGQTTLSQGARLAGLSMEEFMKILGQLGIPVVDYPPEDLEQELEVLRTR
jgi:predicted HTH domain antitoxin